MMRAVGLALLLVGCAAPMTVTQTKIVTPDVPPAMLSCMPEPPIPDVKLQSQAADLLVAIDEAGEDCRQHLAAVKQALEDVPKKGAK
jgi:hypothetical protein